MSCCKNTAAEDKACGLTASEPGLQAVLVCRKDDMGKRILFGDLHVAKSQKHMLITGTIVPQQANHLTWTTKFRRALRSVCDAMSPSYHSINT